MLKYNNIYFKEIQGFVKKNFNQLQLIKDLKKFNLYKSLLKVNNINKRSDFFMEQNNEKKEK